jgi:hypothetical protein
VNIERFTNGEQGCVYVMRFSNGIVKVGRTLNAAKRFTEHARDAARYAAKIEHTWASPQHVGYAANEKALIAFCEQRWHRSGAIEYFADADYGAVTAYAQKLPFERPDAAKAAATANTFKPSVINPNIAESAETAWKVWTGFRNDCLPSLLQPELGANWHNEFTAALAQFGQENPGRELNADDASILARQTFAQMSRREYEDAINHLVIDYWVELTALELDAIGRAAIEGGGR